MGFGELPHSRKLEFLKWTQIKFIFNGRLLMLLPTACFPVLLLCRSCFHMGRDSILSRWVAIVLWVWILESPLTGTFGHCTAPMSLLTIPPTWIEQESSLLKSSEKLKGKTSFSQLNSQPKQFQLNIFSKEQFHLFIWEILPKFILPHSQKRTCVSMLKVSSNQNYIFHSLIFFGQLICWPIF
jgi:hypothetical protein